MQNQQFWAMPYAHQRKPVVAQNVVATTQPLAAQAGLRMIERGGNAVDAALATAIALTVVEPVMTGIGGDAFALVWAEGRLHALNASGRAAKAWTPEYFSAHQEMAMRGWGSVTVPGQVAGWADLSKRFGRLPFADLFEPAIHYAQNGFLVSPVVARQWAMFAPELMPQPGYAEAFTRDGKTPVAGSIWRFPAQAKTLRAIAESNGRDFYEGALARQMADFARKTGGALDEEDLRAHQGEWVEPIQMAYRNGYVLHELPPNGQGIAALMALGMLKHLPAPQGADDADGLFHYPIEAVKLAFADLHQYVTDADHMQGVTERLLDENYLYDRAQLIQPAKASQPEPGAWPGQGGTIYLSAADSEGMMVSFIQSNCPGFGSGVVVPGTGIALQSRGKGFSLQAGHPNLVGPGKRPMHTIIPGFITHQGNPWVSFGVMGGAMQAQGHVQMMQQLVDLGRNPQTAIEAPRFRAEHGGGLWLEHLTPVNVVETLKGYGHDVRVHAHDSLEFGSAQVVMKLAEQSYVAGSDARRDGLALGF